MNKTKGRQVLTRRTLQAMRTREDLLSSTITLIKEAGFAAATTGRIAKQAGMTWGAVQHHFGTKEDILNAILELSYERFLATMTAPGLHQKSMEDRVNQFVDRIWTHYRSDIWLVALEILMGTRETANYARMVWESPRGKVHLAIAREIFPESKLSDARIHEALTYAHFSLTGLGLEGLFEEQVKNLGRHLDRIKGVMLTLLSGA